jgi:hypothetical protein
VATVAGDMDKRVGSNLAKQFDSKAGGGGSLSASLRRSGQQLLAEAGEGKKGKEMGGSGLAHTMERARPFGRGTRGGGGGAPTACDGGGGCQAA